MQREVPAETVLGVKCVKNCVDMSDNKAEKNVLNEERIHVKSGERKWTTMRLTT